MKDGGVWKARITPLRVVRMIVEHLERAHRIEAEGTFKLAFRYGLAQGLRRRGLRKRQPHALGHGQAKRAVPGATLGTAAITQTPHALPLPFNGDEPAVHLFCRYDARARSPPVALCIPVPSHLGKPGSRIGLRRGANSGSEPAIALDIRIITYRGWFVGQYGADQWLRSHGSCPYSRSRRCDSGAGEAS